MRNMNRLDAMSVFVSIADSGSLSGAARRLDLPLASVSRKLADLEAHIGTRLLVRSTRKLALTESGRDYLHACRQILEQVEEAERAAAGAYTKVKGQLVVAAPVVFGRLHLVPVVAQFLERYPEVDVALQLSDRNVHLIEEHVDLALRIGPLSDSNLVATRLGTVHRVVCASPVYLEQHGLPQAPEDLGRHDCVCFEGLEPSSAWTFAGSATAKRPVSVRSRVTVNTADAAIALAVRGMGITRVLSYQIEQELKEGRLLRILAEEESPAVPISLVYPAQGRLPMKSRAFIDWATAQLRERLGTRAPGP